MNNLSLFALLCASLLSVQGMPMSALAINAHKKAKADNNKQKVQR